VSAPGGGDIGRSFEGDDVRTIGVGVLPLLSSTLSVRLFDEFCRSEKLHSKDKLQTPASRMCNSEESDPDPVAAQRTRG
jgi:hypothetical protein